MRAPVLWRRPNARTYSYNQHFGGSYYKPMVDYVIAKDRQGVFFERPTERIHLPDPAETYMNKGRDSTVDLTGVYGMDKVLVKAYSQRTREVNEGTAKTRMRMLNTVTARAHLPHALHDNQQTHYDSVRLLKGAPPGRKQVTYYTSELGVLNGVFDHSQNHSGMGGVTADQKFYDPERVKDYTGAIRFKDPQRSVPVLV